jgi:sialic acid synthase SpsE
MAPRELTLGSIVIGPGRPPLFLAELGAMFNQDVALALELVERVAEARRRVSIIPVMIKGEILHDPSCCLDDDSTTTYRAKSGETNTERYRDLIERKVLPLAAYEQIIGACRAHGIETVMSVYDEAGARFAIDQGVVALKTNSGNITNRPHLRAVAGLGHPMIIDTGRSSLGEIEAALGIARAEGNPGVIVQHSPDGHPAAPGDHHLRSIDTIRTAFDVLTGLSCHSAGTDSLFVAMALGAVLLEKNVVWDENRLEQDYAIAVSIDALPDLLTRIEAAWLSLGQAFRDVGKYETGAATRNRYCLVAAADIALGEVLSAANVRTAFPCKGIPSERYDDVMGWHARAAVAAGKPIGWGDIEP